MATDIIKSNMLLGKASVQVKEMLGNAGVKYKDSEQKTRWIYDIGQGGGGIGFLFHNLGVSFIDNKVILVEHYEVAD